MSLYNLHEATLNENEGQGYAFSEKTVYGKAYKGVFFFDRDAEDEDVQNVSDKEELTFTGILYDRSREKEKTFPISVTDIISTPSGERVDFIATEKP